RGSFGQHGCGDWSGVASEPHGPQRGEAMRETRKSRRSRQPRDARAARTTAAEKNNGARPVGSACRIGDRQSAADRPGIDR
ncbi:hypothetical protein PPH41_43405, partial [Burkholderia gladioli]|nr:hypothetical protein [Burkholderia gladioli]